MDRQIKEFPFTEWNDTSADISSLSSINSLKIIHINFLKEYKCSPQIVVKQHNYGQFILDKYKADNKEYFD